MLGTVKKEGNPRYTFLAVGRLIPTHLSTRRPYPPQNLEEWQTFISQLRDKFVESNNLPSQALHVINAYGQTHH